MFRETLQVSLQFVAKEISMVALAHCSKCNVVVCPAWVSEKMGRTMQRKEMTVPWKPRMRQSKKGQKERHEKENQNV